MSGKEESRRNAFGISRDSDDGRREKASQDLASYFEYDALVNEMAKELERMGLI